MKKQEVELMNKKLSVLLKQPISSINRGSGSVFLDFVELVESDLTYLTEDRKIATRKKRVGFKISLACGRFFTFYLRR